MRPNVDSFIPVTPVAPVEEVEVRPAPVVQGLARAVEWVRAAPTERAPVPLGLALYGSAWVTHWMDAPALGVLGVTAGAMVTAYAKGVRRWGRDGTAGKAVAAVGIGGAWMAGAAEFGPAYGPSGALSWTYWATFAAAYGLYRLDEHTRSMISWRKQKAEWHQLAHIFGIGGSHLLASEDTRLGERLLVDVMGTGRRASTIAASDLHERIAEHYGIPTSRVKVREHRIAGRIWISIRHIDPWAEPVAHPMLDPNPEIPLPEVADIREPVIVGMDPETGKPLTLTVWDEDGAKHTLIVALTRGGKTVLLNDLMERYTAADNVFTIGINVSKAKEMRRWRQALGMSACGPKERIKALRILELVRKMIDHRGNSDSDEVTLIPRRDKPLIKVVIDEASALLGPNDRIGLACREALGYIMSKGGSEGVSVDLVGQRGTVSHTGDADIRTQFTNIIFLKISRRTEMAHAAGELGLELPDMTRYGDGRPGVALVATLDGSWEAGRSFHLKELLDIDALAEGRSPAPLEADLVEHLGDAYTRWTLTDAPDLATPAPAPEDTMPNDRREELAASRQQTREYLANLALPEVSPDMAARMAEAAEVRRAQAAEQTEMSPEVREKLLELLTEGTTPRKASAALAEMGLDAGTSRMGAWRCLDRLKLEGVAVREGEGRGSIWRLADAPAQAGGGDADDDSE